MKLLGSTGSEITEDTNGENAPHLEIIELVLIHCNIVNNNSRILLIIVNSRILYSFVPNKPFGSLLESSPSNNMLLKTFN